MLGTTLRCLKDDKNFALVSGLAVTKNSACMLSLLARFSARLKRGFHPTQRTQRKGRNEMTSLLDRPITAASDDGVCCWHAVKLWQTRHKI